MAVLFLCRKCAPSEYREWNSVVLLRKSCPVHGMAYHIPVQRVETGEIVLAMPLRSWAVKREPMPELAEGAGL